MSVFVLPRILPTILAATLGCAGICAQEKETADGLTEEESKKLESLSFRYDLARTEITQAQWVMPMNKLRKGYRDRMRKLQDQFSKAGDLTKTLAAQAAVKEEPTTETVHAEIKEIAEVQQIFIDAKRKLEKRRDESHEKLARSFIAQLTSIKEKLTKAQRLESALVIEQKIKNIMPNAGAPPASSVKPRPQVLAKSNPVSDFEWKAIGGKVAITVFLGDGAKVVIPNRIDEKPVTSIGDRAFSECKRLKSIAIGDSVASIGKYAFSDCDRLTSVTFGENSQLASIGSLAFMGCTSLKSITIPDDVMSIKNETFRYCTSLTNITIPDSVTSIEIYAFLNCTSLTSITFGENSQLASIGNVAFLRCSSLTSITIGDSINSIGDKAFSECKNLTAVTFLGDAPKTNGMFYSRGISRTIYRKPEAKGWGETFGGWPVKLISEKP